MNNRTLACLDCGLTWTESASKHGPPAKRCAPCAKEYKKAQGRMAMSNRRVAEAAGDWQPSRSAPGANIISDTELRCSRCREVKNVDDFHRATREKSGRQGSCKSCTREYRQAHTRKHSERLAVQYRLKKYGLTMPQIEAMLEAQGNRCAICRTDEPTPGRWSVWAIDHCHKTGKVRGILCHWCNQALGLLRDNPTAALAAADYLLKHQPESRGTNASTTNRNRGARS